MSQKILITGISGFIGSHYALDLLANGYSVRGSVRDLSRTEDLIHMFSKQRPSLSQTI